MTFLCLPSGTLIVLKHPYPRKVEEPSIYESVRVHTAMQTGRTENDLVPTAPSVSGPPSALGSQCPKLIMCFLKYICSPKNSHLGYKTWKGT